MQPERPRARRYRFAASIELVSLESEVEAREQTLDLSLFGCYVRTAKPWASGTKVRIRIIYRSGIFTALGRVVHVSNIGMGVVFTQIGPKDQLLLEKWLAEARDTREQAPQTKNPQIN